jgi:hypothetical protein
MHPDEIGDLLLLHAQKLARLAESVSVESCHGSNHGTRGSTNQHFCRTQSGDLYDSHVAQCRIESDIDPTHIDITQRGE